MITTSRVTASLVLFTAACGEGGTAPRDAPANPDSPELVRVEIVAGAVDLLVFDRLFLEVEGLLSDGSAPRSLTPKWAVVDPEIAGIDAAGNLEGRAVGQTAVIATVEHLSDTATVTVRNPPLASLEVGFSQVALTAGTEVQISVSAIDLQERTVPGVPLAFSSNDPSIATVDDHGVVTGRAIGDTEVHIEGGGIGKSVPVSIRTGWKKVYASFRHACGLTLDGAAYCWGDAHNGALGLGVDAMWDPVELPRPVVGGLRFQDLTLGDSHTCGLTTTGEVYCWGQNRAGAIGHGGEFGCDGDAQKCASPALVAGGLRFASVVAGEDHTCGLDPEGMAYCWGRGAHGQLGVSDPPPVAWAPVRVETDLRFRYLTSASFGATCGLSVDGASYCWGSYFAFWDARCEEAGRCPLPIEMMEGFTFAQVEMGFRGICGLRLEGGLHCWGYQDVPFVVVSVPEPLASLGTTSTGFGVCGLAGDGAPYCTERTGAPPALPAEGLPGRLRLRWIATGAHDEFSVCGVTLTSVAYCWSINEADGLYSDPWLVPEPVENPPAA